MTTPAGMTDLFPAFSLGGVALIGLMARIDPPPLVRWSIVSGLAWVLTLYLTGRIHLYLADRVGLPVYIALLTISGTIIWWNWQSVRAAKRN